MTYCSVVDCRNKPHYKYISQNTATFYLCGIHKPLGKVTLMSKVDWNKDEKQTMKQHGLKPSPGSGNGELFDEDGHSSRLIAQQKTTEFGKSLSIKLQDWNDLKKHAYIAHKTPLFILKFLNGPTLICMEQKSIEEVYLHFDEAGMIEVVEVSKNDGDETDPAEAVGKLL